MRGDPRCYYHYRQRKPLQRLIDLGDITTPNGRQEALSVIFRALAYGRIDNDTAGQMLYLIQMAMHNR